MGSATAWDRPRLAGGVRRAEGFAQDLVSIYGQGDGFLRAVHRTRCGGRGHLVTNLPFSIYGVCPAGASWRATLWGRDNSVYTCSMYFSLDHFS